MCLISFVAASLLLQMYLKSMVDVEGDEILGSFDVSSLFTNVFVGEAASVIHEEDETLGDRTFIYGIVVKVLTIFWLELKKLLNHEYQTSNRVYETLTGSFPTLLVTLLSVFPWVCN